MVRNGYLPERTLTTGVGAVEIQVSKVRDRTGSGIKFNLMLLPPYLKRTQSVEEVLPWLYLKGISTGEFSDALASLLGAQAEGLSASTISHLKAKWIEEHQQWQKRSLVSQCYVYLGADGIYFNSATRMIANASSSSVSLTQEPKNCWDQKPDFKSQNSVGSCCYAWRTRGSKRLQN